MPTMLVIDELTEMTMPKRLTDTERIIRDKVKQDAQKRATVSRYVRGYQTVMADAYKVTPVFRRLHMIEDKNIAMRLRRRAYVCLGGEVRMVNDEGYTNITDAFIARPAECKYCVFEKVEGGAILVNMFELIQSGNYRELTVKPGTDIEFPSVDAAIMYAITFE